MANVTVGDYVTTNYSNPIAIQMKFEIEEMKKVAGVVHAFGQYGGFPITLLKKTKRPVYKKQPIPKRQFTVNEVINHTKFGVGNIIEVTEDKVEVTFESGKTLKFLTYLFEKNLV